MEAFLVASSHSGAGKTTVAVGLMAALAARGRRVQAFKVGPDYIDPSYHRLATGRPSRNLDTWLCSKETVGRLFERSAADVNVIEGVMGLFDGAPGGAGSTAEVAKALGVPVVLVIDASGMAQSVGALVHGFATYDPEVTIAGVVFNRVASERHVAYLQESVHLPVLGWVEHDDSIALPERHLGLIPAAEWRPDVARIGEIVSRHVDVDRLLRLAARNAAPSRPELPPTTVRARIAYALDEAFTFYYQDNLDLLRAAGAELIPVRLLDDPTLPDAGLLYLGGGFPEVFRDRLLANTAMVDAVRRWRGPIYAECGGLMYLSMIGTIPGRIRMTERLQHFGYTEATALTDTPLLRAGETVRGHEFHYSTWDGPVNAYRIRKGGTERTEGYTNGTMLATYVHVHFGSAPHLGACPGNVPTEGPGSPRIRIGPANARGGLARRLVEAAQKGARHGVSRR